MAAFHTVAKAGDVPPGTGRTVEVKGRKVALFNVQGTYHAIDNACLHKGGPLGEGDLEGSTVTCPLHGWRYDVATGRHETNPALGVRCFEVRVEGDQVQVGL